MKQNIKHFSIIIAALIIIAGGLTACSSSRDDSANSPVNSSANSTPTTEISASGSEVVENTNAEQEAVNAEKEKLEKERAKLEKEKQNLKDEKAKTEKMKDAVPPESASQNMYVPNPPTNIRDSPNGKILCTVKKAQTMIKTFGLTGIYDNNGVWIYTNYCGKMGVIHDSQVISPG